MLAREFLISALRIVAAKEGTVLGAGLSGKIKTVVQITCIITILAIDAGVKVFPSLPVVLIASWLIAAVTVWSGVDYLIRHRNLFKTM